MSAERWAPRAGAVLRAADPRMAVLVDADPGLDPDAFFDNWPADLWSALVFQVRRRPAWSSPAFVDT